MDKREHSIGHLESNVLPSRGSVPRSEQEKNQCEKIIESELTTFQGPYKVHTKFQRLEK